MYYRTGRAIYTLCIVDGCEEMAKENFDEPQTKKWWDTTTSTSDGTGTGTGYNQNQQQQINETYWQIINSLTILIQCWKRQNILLFLCTKFAYEIM